MSKRVSSPTLGMRIDDLARKARTSTRNVRAYVTRGLLPAATLRGRVAFYGDAHVERLRLIARLLGRGFSLVSIREVVQAWEKGQDLEALLGLAAVTQPWASEPRFMSAAELAHRAPQLAATPATLEKAIALGLLSREADHRVQNERLLMAGRELVAAGLSAEAVLEALGPLQGLVDQIARLFVDLVRREVWDELVALGLPLSGLPVLAEHVERMRPLASASVDALLAETLDRAIADAATQEIAKVGGARASRRKPATSSKKR